MLRNNYAVGWCEQRTTRKGLFDHHPPVCDWSRNWLMRARSNATQNFCSSLSKIVDNDKIIFAGFAYLCFVYESEQFDEQQAEQSHCRR